MRWLKVVSLCIVLLTVYIVSADEMNREAQLETAEKSYRTGMQTLKNEDASVAEEAFLHAVSLYEQVLVDETAGIDRGRVEFNLGNAFFYAGKIGHAILHYRRADLELHGNLQLAENLMMARKKCIDRFSPKEKSKLLGVIFFWHYDLPMEWRLAIALAANFIFWMLMIAVRFCKALRSPGGICLASIAAVIALACAVSCLVSWRARAREGNPAVIVASQADARKGADSSFDKAFENPLHEGTECQAIRRKGDWWQIELPDERRAWIPASTLEII